MVTSPRVALLRSGSSGGTAGVGYVAGYACCNDEAGACDELAERGALEGPGWGAPEGPGWVALEVYEELDGWGAPDGYDALDDCSVEDGYGVLDDAVGLGGGAWAGCVG